MDASVIRFSASIYKLQTLADGGIRVTLDLPETAIETMAQLARVRSGLLQIAAVPYDAETIKTWRDQPS